MKVLVFTVDMDRDCNTAAKGKKEAVSRRCGEMCMPQYAASVEGMTLLTDMLHSIGVQATVFAEGDTLINLSDRSILDRHEVACHGMSHEDLTGAKSGVPLGDLEVRHIIKRSKRTVEGVVGMTPLGFRAPYLNIDARVLNMLREEGFVYDSSITKEITNGTLCPWRMSCGLWEFPLARSIDGHGRPMDSYLWALHEGRRPEEDYLMMLESFREGLLVLATHSWHPLQSVISGEKGRSRAEGEIISIERILAHAKDLGFEILTFSSLLGSLNGDR
ncbi:MAG: peptidoglycan-N-acetylglucosamine deacetylase [Candidatus Methanomethylophilaceae archaeon]|nr:peptidoglycan-N-acetylglucosamine deacetylase [Candidatus Methanomethylophilaceae archaeon]MDI3541135.1 peptidoglycan-N-acetylglucosamine deacetylase [Candidatus Methanomethylophilaceae archaeon]HIJ00617.1 polysaccharide deacetylase family protein [Candidatus Methanomethylophilaceae archaeon]